MTLMESGELGGDTAPPGWYPDPKLEPRERYFDGREWTSSVRDGNGLTSDPMGPLPSGRDAWIAPGVMDPLHRPATPTWWHRHRARVAVVVGAVALAAIVVAAIVRPRALGTVALAAVVAFVLGERLWLTALGRDERDDR